MRLVITAQPLNGRWSITTANRRDQAEWPPSPDTLFSALVAAAATSLGNACHPALYWLEQQGNPTIEAAEKPSMVHGVVTFDPVADVPMWGGKSRKQRWHNSIGEPSSVSWSWSITSTEHVEALQSIAREIPYIGSSRGPVVASASITMEPPTINALIPRDGGRLRIRGLYVGRLDDLEAAYQKGERPRPAQTVGYGNADEIGVTSPWGQMIPLRREKGPAMYLSHTVPMAEAVRRAITQHLPDGAPAALTGHGADRDVLRDEHLAVVPMPRVDDRYADGELLGAGLMLPRTLSDEDYGVLVGGLASWLQKGGRVDIGGLRWEMAVAANDHRRALKETRFEGSARAWSSVTPVVLDRHPRRTLTPHDVLSAMCRDVGLPAPVSVETAPQGLLDGTEPSRKHHLGDRGYLRNRTITHARVTWDREVPGPVLLGRGRYFGLGIMLPARSAA